MLIFKSFIDKKGLFVHFVSSLVEKMVFNQLSIHIFVGQSIEIVF